MLFNSGKMSHHDYKKLFESVLSRADAEITESFIKNLTLKEVSKIIYLQETALKLASHDRIHALRLIIDSFAPEDECTVLPL
jgi:hypothetical protein